MVQRTTMKWSPVFLRLALGVAIALSPVSLDAQVVRGQVLAAEDNSTIRGAFVILVDTLGRQRAASLSDATGSFRIQAPEPGIYQLRWELVGRPVDQSPRFELKAGTETSLRIFSFTMPQTLGSVQVSAASSCPSNPDSERVASLWVEIAKALRVSQWSMNDDRLLFDVETIRRDWDPKFETVAAESRVVHEGMKGRPFETMPPDFLAEYGYMVASGPQQHYFAPDEKSLLHDTFIAQHCLSLAKPPAGLETLIGIAFAPVPGRTRPDISGVFWLNRDSLLLRAIDYRYSGLQQFAMHESLGGRMEFGRVPSGEWYIARWRIRMPVLTLCRSPGIFGFLTPRSRPCLQSIVEVAGEVLDVRQQI
jgi:hypothetical protein